MYWETRNFVWLTFLWQSLSCHGLKSNPQYVRGRPAPCLQLGCSPQTYTWCTPGVDGDSLAGHSVSSELTLSESGFPGWPAAGRGAQAALWVLPGLLPLLATRCCLLCLCPHRVGAQHVLFTLVFDLVCLVHLRMSLSFGSPLVVAELSPWLPGPPVLPVCGTLSAGLWFLQFPVCLLSLFKWRGNVYPLWTNNIRNRALYDQSLSYSDL